MGGGGKGDFDTMSLISNLVFSAAGGLLGGTPTTAPQSGGSADTASQEADTQAAEARRRADRQKAEAALLAKTRQAERADLSGRDDQAQSLGAPNVSSPQLAAAQLKETLGQ